MKLAFRAEQMVGRHPEPPDYILPLVSVGYLKMEDSSCNYISAYFY